MKHPMRQLADVLSEAAQPEPNRIEPDGQGYRIIFDNQHFGNIVRRDDGWVVTNVATNKRMTHGSRYPHPSPQRAFYAYFGNARAYKPWIAQLAKQLPSDVPERPDEDKPVDLDALITQGNAAHDEANRLDGQLRDLFARLSAKKPLDDR